MSPWKAVVFDLDGTLVDSAPDLAAAANRLLHDLGRAGLPPEGIRPMIGDGVARLVERALARGGGLPAGATLEAMTERFLAHYAPIVARSTRPYAAVMETLALLAERRLLLAVCTNKPERLSRALLGELGLLSVFAVIAGGDSAPAKKPDRRHLDFVLARLGVGPREAVMVGDNEHDLAVARAAGVKVILVTYGYSREPVAALRPDALIDSMAELPARLAELA